MELPDQIRAKGDDLARFVESLPAEAFSRSGPIGEWSLAEICGHAAEFPPFHARVLRRIAAGDERARVGRGDDDADRQAGIRRFGGARPADVAKAIRAAADECAATLAAIPPDGWTREARTVSGELFTVREAAESRIRDHLAAHLNQARRAAAR